MIFSQGAYIKVLIVTRYHDRTLSGYVPGGDETVHGYIEQALIMRGHTVNYLSLSNSVGKINLLRKVIGSKLILGEPYLTSKTFKKIEQKYDVVICNSVFGYGINHPRSISLFHFSSFGAKEFFKFGQNFNLKKYIAFSRWAFQEKQATRNKCVVSVSEYLKGYLEKQGINVSKVINNCIDTAKFFPKNNEVRKNCVFVGRADYFLKGFDVLEKLSGAGIKIDCYSNTNIGNGLVWKGNVENSKMTNIYNKYELLLFPSRFESVGLVPLEAMACGVPVLMSNVGFGNLLKKEIPEFVIDGWNDDSVKQYIERRIMILSKYEEFSKKARCFVEKYFSFEIFSKEWCTLVEDVASRNRN